ncbi:hypothetical protein MIR68_011401 [Amoeboaphelidium protococcarum]|nr:hypothetical protein MIR68_011401 [Amoeboaphelidium protococcarum]
MQCLTFILCAYHSYTLSALVYDADWFLNSSVYSYCYSCIGRRRVDKITLLVHAKSAVGLFRMCQKNEGAPEGDEGLGRSDPNKHFVKQTVASRQQYLGELLSFEFGYRVEDDFTAAEAIERFLIHANGGSDMIKISDLVIMVFLGRRPEHL